MRRFAFLIFVVCVFAPLASRAQDGALLAHWVQLGPAGVIQARVAVRATHCPDIFIDGHATAMRLRAASDQDFVLVCEADIPSRAKSATVLNAVMALPVAQPERIAVLGDTGCRIKGAELQACNDPAKWPFPELASAAAKLKPDLVIHVGDFLYRESACPAGNQGCAGTPFGDNWPTWTADFFAPAAPLLDAAPWVVVRGNHEDCARAGPGFLRLLGPLAFDAAVPCAAHLAPYSVPVGAVNLVVMDDANAPDTSVDTAMVATYRAEFAALASAPQPSWLVAHRPVWAAISGPLGIPIGGNQTLIEAIGKDGIPSPVELMLAGHIHAFEALNYTAKVPPQILAGHGGDNLDSTPAILKGAIFQGDSGVTVKDGLSIGGFGFLLLSKTAQGWNIDLYKKDGTHDRQCVFAGGRVDCPKS